MHANTKAKEQQRKLKQEAQRLKKIERRRARREQNFPGKIIPPKETEEILRAEASGKGNKP